MSVFRTGAVVHRQRGSRQAAEECRHFTLRQETGGAFGEAVGRRTAQLRTEDGQRAADAVAADVEVPPASVKRISATRIWCRPNGSSSRSPVPKIIGPNPRRC